mmetsp:Transcript_29978/g.51785  ORF Transcript_29978/g.51785 Transcript_29978/m.51785 type:complete len:336 (-) Transcript_29978:1173-2180(-)
MADSEINMSLDDLIKKRERSKPKPKGKPGPKAGAKPNPQQGRKPNQGQKAQNMKKKAPTGNLKEDKPLQAPRGPNPKPQRTNPRKNDIAQKGKAQRSNQRFQQGKNLRFDKANANRGVGNVRSYQNQNQQRNNYQQNNRNQNQGIRNNPNQRFNSRQPNYNNGMRQGPPRNTANRLGPKVTRNNANQPRNLDHRAPGRFAISRPQQNFRPVPQQQRENISQRSSRSGPEMPRGAPLRFAAKRTSSRKGSAPAVQPTLGAKPALPPGEKFILPEGTEMKITFQANPPPPANMGYGAREPLRFGAGSRGGPQGDYDARMGQGPRMAGMSRTSGGLYF